MRRINISLDEETSDLLAKCKNQSSAIRESVKMYHAGITPDRVETFKAMFIELRKRMDAQDALLKDIDSKLNYMANTQPKL